MGVKPLRITFCKNCENKNVVLALHYRFIESERLKEAARITEVALMTMSCFYSVLKERKTIHELESIYKSRYRIKWIEAIRRVILIIRVYKTRKFLASLGQVDHSNSAKKSPVKPDLARQKSYMKTLALQAAGVNQEIVLSPPLRGNVIPEAEAEAKPVLLRSYSRLSTPSHDNIAFNKSSMSCSFSASCEAVSQPQSPAPYLSPDVGSTSFDHSEVEGDSEGDNLSLSSASVPSLYFPSSSSLDATEAKAQLSPLKDTERYRISKSRHRFRAVKQPSQQDTQSSPSAESTDITANTSDSPLQLSKASSNSSLFPVAAPQSSPVKSKRKSIFTEKDFSVALDFSSSLSTKTVVPGQSERLFIDDIADEETDFDKSYKSLHPMKSNGRIHSGRASPGQSSTKRSDAPLPTLGRGVSSSRLGSMAFTQSADSYDYSVKAQISRAPSMPMIVSALKEDKPRGISYVF